MKKLIVTATIVLFISVLIVSTGTMLVNGQDATSDSLDGKEVIISVEIDGERSMSLKVNRGSLRLISEIWNTLRDREARKRMIIPEGEFYKEKRELYFPEDTGKNEKQIY